MRVCVCVCVCVYIYMCVCTYMCMYVCIYVCVCVAPNMHFSQMKANARSAIRNKDISNALSFVT